MRSMNHKYIYPSLDYNLNHGKNNMNTKPVLEKIVYCNLGKTYAKYFQKYILWGCFPRNCK